VPAVEQQEDTGHMQDTSLPDLGHILDDIARQITGEGIDIPARFHFIWQNIDFAGQILPAGKGTHFSLNLVAGLGHIPFSAEDKIRRKKLLEIFSPLFLRGDYSLSVNSDIQMTILTDFAGPVNARRLMEVITLTLLDLLPDITSLRNAMTGQAMT